jgi:hypothetical protein
VKLHVYVQLHTCMQLYLYVQLHTCTRICAITHMYEIAHIYAQLCVYCAITCVIAHICAITYICVIAFEKGRPTTNYKNKSMQFLSQSTRRPRAIQKNINHRDLCHSNKTNLFIEVLLEGTQIMELHMEGVRQKNKFTVKPIQSLVKNKITKKIITRFFENKL